MGMFEKFKKSDDGVTGGGDQLGGFVVHESDVYSGTVKLLFFGESAKGAQFAEVHLALSGGGEMRQRIYMTNRSGENTYKDKTTGELRFMPGFETINDLCLVTTGFGLTDLEERGEIEEKTVKLWDTDAKAETPQNVPVATSVIGEAVTMAIQKITEDKTKDDGNGNYRPTGDTRDVNEIAKFFHAETNRTVTEIEKGLDEGIFCQKWLERNQGKTKDNSKGVQQGNSGAPGRSNSGAPANAAQKKSSGLFNK